MNGHMLVHSTILGKTSFYIVFSPFSPRFEGRERGRGYERGYLSALEPSYYRKGCKW
jgi:hypothetical protein